jgi:hypothetical protein
MKAIVEALRSNRSLLCGPKAAVKALDYTCDDNVRKILSSPDGLVTTSYDDSQQERGMGAAVGPRSLRNNNWITDPSID